MNAIRWWLFRRFSSIGWAICPEPQKSDLQRVMPSWADCAEAWKKEAGQDG